MVCLIALLSCMSLSAQEANPEALFRTRLAADSILLESFADGNVDYGVFGRYARDTARYHALKSRFEACDTTLFGSDLLFSTTGPPFGRITTAGTANKPGKDSTRPENSRMHTPRSSANCNRRPPRPACCSAHSVRPSVRAATTGSAAPMAGSCPRFSAGSDSSATDRKRIPSP